MDRASRSLILATNAECLSGIVARARDCGAICGPADVLNAIESVGDAVRAHGFDPLTALMAMRFCDETPPPPPYRNVRFDDRREAEDFVKRVRAAHGVDLRIRPGRGRVLFVEPV